MKFRLRFLAIAGAILLWCATMPVLAQPTPPPDWMVMGGRDFARIGGPVARAGDVDGDGYDDILVGAPFQDSNVAAHGAAYLYRGSPAGPEPTAAWSYVATGTTYEFGFALAAAGDMDGDGYDDVAVGAPGSGGPSRVFVFMGGPGGLSAEPAAILEGYGIQSSFGNAVAGAGDANGDGYDDLLIGSPNYKLPGYGGAQRGWAYIYLGGPGGISTSPATILDPGRNWGNFGWAVAGAGDIDGDGLDDVLVGDQYFDIGADATENQGKVSLFHGSALGVETTPAWTAVGAQFKAMCGTSVSGAGDVNGDGFRDIVIGSPQWGPTYNPDPGTTNLSGRVDVYFGSALGLGTTPGWTAYGAPGTTLGYKVSADADANGDGYDDILTGASGVSHPEYDEGQIVLYYGGASGPGAIPAWRAESNRAGGGFGLALAFAGDTNGDTLDDILVGVGWDITYVYEGAALLYFGRPTSNLPPQASIAPIAAQECAGPAGAPILLDASGSVDLNSTPGTNDDIVGFNWYEGYGTPGAFLLGSGETLQVTLGIGTHSVTLDAIDAAGEHDTASTEIVVEDTMPPVVSLSLTPALLWPPNHRMVDDAAQVVVADTCGGATFDLAAVTSSEPDDAPGDGDGRTTGDIAGAGDVPGDTALLLRAERSGAGAGRVYTVTYVATDGAGNSIAASATVSVPLTRNGMSEPLMLQLQEGPAGTTVSWLPVTDASSYDLARGDLDALADAGEHVDLGAPVCLASGLTQVSSAGWEDAAVPAPGKGFYYLVQYRSPEPVTFGTDSAMKPRIALAGGCP